jgi:hypothetical protein
VGDAGVQREEVLAMKEQMSAISMFKLAPPRFRYGKQCCSLLATYPSTWSERGATLAANYSFPEPCWLFIHFSRPFCSDDLVVHNYFWCKLALNG